MLGDEAERFREQGPTRFSAMPGGGAGGVREWNEILRAPVEFEFPAPADNICQRVKLQKLGDGELSHGQHKLRAENFELAPQPVRTLLDLVFAGNAIASTRVFSGKAPADCREVDPASSRLLVPPQGGLEPAKERFASGPGEWASEQGFLDAGRLTNQEDPACDGPPKDNGLVHAGASLAVRQSPKVSAQGAHDQPKSTEAMR